jgi:hypothetical protein
MAEDPLDPALFVALFLGVTATVYAMGEPLTKTEIRLRLVTLVLCAVIAVIMCLWLIVGILHRFGLLQLLND